MATILAKFKYLVDTKELKNASSEIKKMKDNAKKGKKGISSLSVGLKGLGAAAGVATAAIATLD